MAMFSHRALQRAIDDSVGYTRATRRFENGKNGFQSSTVPSRNMGDVEGQSHGSEAADVHDPDDGPQ